MYPNAGLFSNLFSTNITSFSWVFVTHWGFKGFMYKLCLERLEDKQHREDLLLASGERTSPVYIQVGSVPACDGLIPIASHLLEREWTVESSSDSKPEAWCAVNMTICS